MDVIVYGSADNPKWKNRGFAFLEYDSHKSASAAKRRFTSRSLKAWGGEFVVDWADPLEEPDSSTMSKVKYCYYLCDLKLYQMKTVGIQSCRVCLVCVCMQYAVVFSSLDFNFCSDTDFERTKPGENNKNIEF